MYVRNFHYSLFIIISPKECPNSRDRPVFSFLLFIILVALYMFFCILLFFFIFFVFVLLFKVIRDGHPTATTRYRIWKKPTNKPSMIIQQSALVLFYLLVKRDDRELAITLHATEQTLEGAVAILVPIISFLYFAFSFQHFFFWLLFLLFNS